MIEVVPKKFHVISKVVVQSETHAVIFEGGGDIRAESNRVHPVSTGDCRVITLRHHSPQAFDRWADADAARIASDSAIGPTCGGSCQIVLDTVERDDALAQRIGRHDAGNLYRLGEPTNLVVSEEK